MITVWGVWETIPVSSVGLPLQTRKGKKTFKLMLKMPMTYIIAKRLSCFIGVEFDSVFTTDQDGFACWTISIDTLTH